MQSGGVENVGSRVRLRGGLDKKQSKGDLVFERSLIDWPAPRSEFSRSSTNPASGSQLRTRSF